MSKHIESVEWTAFIILSKVNIRNKIVERRQNMSKIVESVERIYHLFISGECKMSL
jgi:hypothetical protein